MLMVHAIKENILWQVEKPTDAQQWNHVLTTGFKRMQIMADVGHKRKHEDGTLATDDPFYYDERILCIIKVMILY